VIERIDMLLNRPRLLIAGVLAAAAAALPLAATAHAAPAEPIVPTTIAVPAGNKLFLVGHASGVQIYKCNAAADGPRWSFAGPRADLYGDNGRLIATHFAGPTWQAVDGSRAVGSVVRPAPVDPTAIPWLLLSASGTSGPDGDRLAGTTFIQRIATTGGLMPATDACSASTVGVVNEVPYTADYYFWKASAS
jgi:hypothetical protein